MSFPISVAEKALLDSGRHCCLCHKFCGTKIELHHIVQKSDGGKDSYENCIPLCFDCHAEVKAYNPKHPKGRKYTESELRSHRDNWYQKTKNSYGIIANPNYVEVDKQLFEAIRKILPPDGSMRFIRNHDYGAAFNLNSHDDVDEFLYKCEDPAIEFLDIDLEGMRVQLEISILEFRNAIGQYTFPEPGKKDWNRIPREPTKDFEFLAWIRDQAKTDDEYNKMIKDQRQHIHEIQHKINDLAQNVYETYSEFIRLGRRKLGVM